MDNNSSNVFVQSLPSLLKRLVQKPNNSSYPAYEIAARI